MKESGIIGSCVLIKVPWGSTAFKLGHINLKKPKNIMNRLEKT